LVQVTDTQIMEICRTYHYFIIC